VAVKRVVIISDMHCGHCAGLTPHEWAYEDETVDPKHNKYAQMQSDMWEWYNKQMEALKPIDVLICNGDAIDGKGVKSGGTEQIESDRRKQAQMATQCIEVAEAKKIYLIHGTPYHTGTEEDWEDVVADNVGAAKIGSHEWIDVNGLVFDCKHKVGSSGIPHGRYTAIAKEQLWNQIWAMDGGQPLGDVIIRSHVHYYRFAGDGKRLALTTPALQGPGTKYGAKEMSGTVDTGFIHFNVESKTNYVWQKHIMEAATWKPEVLIA